MTEYETRLERARHVTIEDVREPLPGVYEIDAVNENGHKRDCLTIIPEKRYEATKDLQYRGTDGVVGKYSLALAMQNDEVWDALVNEASADLEETKDDLSRLRTRKQNLEKSIRHLRMIVRDAEE